MLVQRGNSAVKTPGPGEGLAHVPGNALGASVAQVRWKPFAWGMLSIVPLFVLYCSSIVPLLFLYF
jgi:hypothetical protein